MVNINCFLSPKTQALHLGGLPQCPVPPPPPSPRLPLLHPLRPGLDPVLLLLLSCVPPLVQGRPRPALAFRKNGGLGPGLLARRSLRGRGAGRHLRQEREVCVLRYVYMKVIFCYFIGQKVSLGQKKYYAS